ncbi:MAG: phosphate ABC transporter substrate-binding protein [Nitrospirae bacterium]|nr:phosphate ABC transporter substrate-binding protein [Nitrospirota bacterium]
MKRILFLVLCICVLSMKADAERIVGNGAEQYYEEYGDTLKIDGSTTILPIAQKAAEIFMMKNPEITVFVSGRGSEIGINALINGTIDIAIASREAKAEEIESGKEKGVILMAHKIALDGVVPIVHPSIKIANVTMEQLRNIYNGKIKNWKELGGPDESIVVYTRDIHSGTYTVWSEKVLHRDTIRTDAFVVATSSRMVRSVAENKYAIGYIGIGYIDKSVKALKIDGKTATEENVRDGSWPIVRSLYMYTNGRPGGLTAEFIDFIMSEEGQNIVTKAKYISIK